MNEHDARLQGVDLHDPHVCELRLVLIRVIPSAKPESFGKYKVNLPQIPNEIVFQGDLLLMNRSPCIGTLAFGSLRVPALACYLGWDSGYVWDRVEEIACAWKDPWILVIALQSCPQ